MTAWKPAPERARIRNGTVVSVSGGNATVRMDGSVDVPNLPVYGTVAAGQGVLVLEQGASLLVLGPGGSGGGVPAGAVMQWAGAAAAPAGWLLCDGAAVSRTAYAALFSAIGTTYGIGDGSTTFNLPDFRTRVLAGHSASDPDFNTVGKKGGAKTHTLTTNEMPSHTHSWDGNVTAALNLAGSGGLQGAQTTARASLLPTGGGGAHNNLQPYAVVNHIIKT